MYFKVSMRKNPESGVYSGYYRLVESYPNEDGRVSHRTMVNAGYLDDLNANQLVVIQKLITEKAENCNNPLFTYQESDDSLVNSLCKETPDRKASGCIINKMVGKRKHRNQCA
ncbi:hypothetical protein [Saccharicrinis fermentans]|uniref:Uncharacterized protein n=1 Tax=Saccharicrinis fermentans DSM 9555 = JCM 21142 TaxID=869213 RepID=W7Y232_9BACT|nr:hypothetical protein [Saccharicrinis fermentans]GAF02017.1 hypothetical protein JCM21142_1642 [Saccharicrinis fermentans DSM 9555 = JCM 21142]